MPSPEPTITKVHEDTRGALYAINLPGDRELMLLHSKAGSRRGGHSHTCPETVMVLTGTLEYDKLSPDGWREMHTLAEGQTDTHPAGLVHMGYFPEESWILEWKLAKKGEWKNVNYAPWRELVDANARGE